MEKSLRVKFLLCALLGAAVLLSVSCGGGVSQKAGEGMLKGLPSRKGGCAW